MYSPSLSILSMSKFDIEDIIHVIVIYSLLVLIISTLSLHSLSNFNGEAIYNYGEHSHS